MLTQTAPYLLLQRSIICGWVPLYNKKCLSFYCCPKVLSGNEWLFF